LAQSSPGFNLVHAEYESLRAFAKRDLDPVLRKDKKAASKRIKLSLIKRPPIKGWASLDSSDETIVLEDELFVLPNLE
jgi:hypothetical protein